MKTTNLRLAKLCALVFLGLGSGSAVLADEPSPTQCLKSFMATVYGAKQLKQVEQYMCKNQRDSYRSLDIPGRNKKLDELKLYYLGSAKYSDEKINGTNATVTVRGIGYQPSLKKNVSQSETFDLVREDKYWRIAGARLSATFKL